MYCIVKYIIQKFIYCIFIHQDEDFESLTGKSSHAEDTRDPERPTITANKRGPTGAIRIHHGE